MSSANIQNKREATLKPQIVIKRVFKYPVEQVWQSISDKEALSDWLMETTDFELKKDHHFKFTTEPRGNFDGKISCQLINFVEHSELYYSWQASSMAEPTYVRWTLKEIEKDKTFVKLEHYGFEGFSGWFTKQMLNFGWKRLLSKKLSQYLSNEERPMASIS